MKSTENIGKMLCRSTSPSWRVFALWLLVWPASDRLLQASTVSEICRLVPSPPSTADMYSQAKAAMDSRTCVSYNDSALSRDFLSLAVFGQVNSSCPTFAQRYLSAAGVSLLPLPEGSENMTFFSGDEFVARLRWTACFMSKWFGGELSYFRVNRNNIVNLMASVQWDGSTATDMARRVDLLTCSTLFPPCEVINSQLLEVRPCDWFCEDIRRALLPVADAMAVQPQALATNGFYNLLFLTVARCVPNNAVTDLSMNGTSLTASPPRCQNCTKRSCNELYVTKMTPGTVAAQGPAGRLCFNATKSCVWPFVATKDSSHWDKRVQDRLRLVVHVTRALLNMSPTALPFNGSFLPCAQDCQTTVVLSESDERDVRNTTRVLSWLVFTFGLFALGSFVLDWRRMNRYPKRILFFLNGCVFVGNFGILGQDFTSSPSSYLCHPDGSMRIKEPNSSGACTFLFILLYFFLMSSVAWWVCLAHAWYVTLPCIKQPDFGRSKNARYERWYHLFTWPVIFSLTVAQLANHEVGGSTLYGICWMYRDIARFGYMVVPLTIASILGTAFLGLGMNSFYRARQSWRTSLLSLDTKVTAKVKEDGVPPEQASQPQKKGRNQVERTMRRFLIKLWILLIGVQLHMFVQVVVGAYRRVHWDDWIDQAERRLTCLLSTCHDPTPCPPLPTPSVVLLAVPVAASTTFALTTYIWVFNRVTFKCWKRLLVSIGRGLKTRTRPVLSESPVSYTVQSTIDTPEAKRQHSLPDIADK